MGDMYKPSGELQGDTKSIPFKDSVNVTDTYGASVTMDSTNDMGKITGSTKSESPFENMPCGEDC